MLHQYLSRCFTHCFNKVQLFRLNAHITHKIQWGRMGGWHRPWPTGCDQRIAQSCAIDIAAHLLQRVLGSCLLLCIARDEYRQAFIAQELIFFSHMLCWWEMHMEVVSSSDFLIRKEWNYLTHCFPANLLILLQSPITIDVLHSVYRLIAGVAGVLHCDFCSPVACPPFNRSPVYLGL